VAFRDRAEGDVVSLNRAELARLRRKHQRGLEAIAVELTNQAKLRATRHVDTGEFRNSITHAVTDGGRTVLWGVPATRKNVSLEKGFRPHWLPVQRAGVWMRRHNVGTIVKKSRSSKGRLRTYKFLAAGILVGGPNSTLDQGPGMPGGLLFGPGGKLVFRRWNTRGEKSKFLAPNKVGFSVLQHTVATKLRPLALPAFARGFNRG
jgi:hypothetical protein